MKNLLMNKSILLLILSVFAGVWSVNAQCTDPTIPTITYAPATVCDGDPTTLTISGTLNDATEWFIYSGSCGGTLVGSTTGTTFVVNPTLANFTYFVRGEGGCVVPGACGSVAVTVTSPDNSSFNYSAASFCMNASDPTPTISGLAGGTFTSSPAGLVINSATGTIDLSASAINTYTITYTTSGACPTSTNATVSVTGLDNVAFNYSAPAYCVVATDPTPTISGVTGGTFSATPFGLFINATTGTIDVSASIPNTYTVTYTTSGPCGNSSNVSIQIVSTLDNASFNYSSFLYCTNNPNPTPTITGLPGGTFSSFPAGLSLNPTTGEINILASAINAYSVVYTTNGVCQNSSNVLVILNAAPNTDFTYPSNTYCANESDPIPTVTGAPGGTFTSSPAGMVINSSSGLVDLSASTPGTYTITYSILGICPNSSTFSMTINAQDDADFSYSAPFYCVFETDPTPTITGLAGGTFTSSPAGLVLNASTGEIDLSASTPNTYVVTYTTNGTCPNSSNVGLTVTPLDDATFAYSALSYCTNEADQTPTITGIAGGTFTSAPAGLTIDPTTGTVELSTSTVGTYTVTYSTVGACPNTMDVSLTVNEMDDASFSYANNTFCVSDTDPTPTITGLAGGTFTSLPAGLSINATTGEIDLSASTPNSYTVTYTTNGTCPNEEDFALVINPLDDASFSYSDPTYCVDDTDPTPTITGLAGGSFTSSPAGLSLDATTGTIDLSASTSGTYTITYTTNGACPNSSDVSITIGGPVAAFSGDNLNSDCSPLLVNFTDASTSFSPIATWSWDFGDGNTSNVQNPSNNYTALGSYDVTLVVTDVNGCSNTLTLTSYINLVDSIDPVFTLCPINQTISLSGTCDYTIPDYSTIATYSDNCGLTFSQNPASGTVITGNQNVVLTLIDDAGNTAICSFDLTLVDDIDPVITCPTDITINTDPGLCTSTATIGTPTATDNCGVPVVTNDAPAEFPIGATTVTWTATDAAGNTATCTHVVTVVDTENPVITCPDDLVIDADAGLCTSTKPIGIASATDNCGIPSVTSDAPAIFNLGTTIVTWTAIDGAGNIITCLQSVTIVDSQPPIISCPTDITVDADAGLCTSSTAIGTATATDNCGVPTITNDAPAVFPIGATTVTWTATDGAGNTATCTQTITVEDAENPVITCPTDITINTDAGLCTSTAAIGTATATDNCGAPTVTNDAPAAFPIGNTTVTWTATDAAGNTATCAQIVTVVDAENPVITCPTDITINTDAGLCTSTAAIGTATATDNCGVPTVTNDAPAVFPIGATTVTWTATDAAGNVATCAQIVTVVDAENPVITCPTDITVDADAGLCTSSTAIGTATATDNCGVPTITNDAPAVFPIGATTVTWTATDGAGNTATCTQTITVEDAENPVITCPTDITINTDAGLCTSTAAIGTATATDNCGVPTVTNDAPTAFPIGNTTVTWTATDAAGNTATCTQVVTVVDAENPVITCPTDITINTDAGLCTSTAAIGTATATDNCGVPTVTNDAPAVFPIGNTTVTWTATDAAGNVATCAQIVIVVDAENPVITCPTDITVDADAGLCTSSTAIGTATATDNCGVPTITNDAPAVFPIGATTVTWTATDGAGNTATCTQTITVEDAENPVITCPTDITINTDAGLCTSTAAIGTATATDNCGVPTVTNDAPTAFPIGNTTVTWTATDAAGNTATCTQVVTVVDAENPVITCPTDITINTDAGLCTSTAAIGTATATDNCGVPTVTNDAPAVFPIGNTTVTWTATDAAGNVATCAQIVTVVDAENPVITCPTDITVDADAGLCTSSTAIGTATATDNCGVPTITNDAPAVFPIGATTVTWTATDASGNTATCTQTITVEDAENPVITCPTDITINTDAGLCTSTAAIGTATATDNCGAPTVTNDAPTAFPIGNTTVTWTATDAAGNTATCTQVVTVVDAENPVITCPTDITINTDAGLCTSTAAIGTATATDNCGVPTVTNDAPAVFPIGNTTVTWTATDAAGNVATCAQIVTVVDAENPVITCPTDITVDADAGLCTSSTAIGTATATDNCGVPTITNDAPAVFPIGATTVTWTATDASGNTATCTQTITVEDAENPVITCPTDITINTDAGLCTSTAAIGTATATDNCGAPAVTSDAPASFPIGNTTVTWTATDAAGNTATCTQVVTVVDAENPVITCPTDITINTDAGLCSSTAAIGTATATDNCGVPTVTNDAPAVFPIGNTTVTWTATDAAGNVATCAQIVTVVDAENPVITCPTDITVDADAGLCTSSTAIGTATATDNCGVPTITNDAPAVFPIGNTTVTWTATDASGNTATCTQTITVEDAENPVITCPTDITINTDAGLCTSTAAIGTATATDNCGAPTVTNDAPASFPIGNTTVTWTATDAAGNTATCTQVVTVVDAENPVITCPTDITINTDAGLCTSTAAIGTATATDNCGVPTVTNDAPAVFPIGNTTVTWTATDAAGNVATCAQIVTVVDAENPVISCPTDITVDADAGLCTSSTAIGTATATDNCGVPTITNDAPAVFPIGATTVTWTATDGAGNTATCTQTITVEDAENPVITCPTDITINTDAGLCTSTAAIGTATATDNCGAPTVTNDAPAAFPIGNTTVTWTATDAAGNTATCAQIVTVVDAENPVITCPTDITINTDAGLCTSTAAIGTATATDNCGVPTVTNDAPAVFPIGATTVTWTATDAAGNVATCAQIVTVVDAENPVITCPTDITVDADAGLCTSSTAIGTATATDNCGVPTITNDAPAVFPIGATTVTWTATDGAGNTATCTQTITVEDAENPVITCPTDITINTDAGLCTSTAAIGTATATDNCGVPTVTNDAPTAFPIGNTTVTWTATDAAGNTATCTQIVTVVDAENPVITCPTDITINTDAGLCTSTAAIGTATATDNCGVPTVTNDAPAVFPIGNTTVTWTATDAAGNVATCAQIVTVVDAENPVITCPTDITVDADAGLCTSSTAIGTATATDNCGVPTITNNAPAVFPVGTTTVTWTATDGGGNIATCAQIVTVVDAETPAITCPPATTINTDAGLCTSTAAFGTATATDNCGVPTVTNDAPAAFPIGNTTVTWTATDAAGNTATCTQVVTVVDAENPVITCPTDITINTDAGLCTSTAAIGTATATDNCGVPTITNNAPAVFPIGNTTVTWTATDAAGNVTTCAQIVTVVDSENPVITCPTAISLNADAGLCTSSASIGTATASDNCGVPTITNNAPAVFPVGTTTVTWTATDGGGNIATCTQIVTVVDAETPAITCPPATTINTDAGLCTSTAAFGTATATDNCGVPIVTNDAPTAFPIGNTTVTWTATDAAGNTATCTQVVTVVDAENPVITCPAAITINTDAGLCTSTAAIGNATATDNCSVPTITNNAPAVFPIGNTTVTWTATDAAGNVTTCAQIVTVVDSENPVITCPTAISLNADAGLCTSSASIGTATATDNCGVPTITNNAPAVFPVGTTTVTWTATDGGGNIATCTQIVTVVDAETPAITCPPATTINTDAGLCTSTAAIGTATATDNCGVPTVTNNAPASFPIGATTVTWTATDAAGNTATCTQVVTVVDAQNPVIICPVDVTIFTDAGDCTSSAPFGVATATDNCGIPTITNDAPANFPFGNNIVTWTATDAAGNTTTCTQLVKVEDLQDPTIICPPAITINTDPGSCASTAPIGLATGTDNCGVPTITNDAPATFPIGNTTVTWTATDNANNIITCTQLVTVVDNQDPTIICPSAVTLVANIGSCSATGSIGNATGADNCATPVITNNAPAIFPIGATTVTWTATDAAGNTTTCTQLVTVVDQEGPTVSCLGDVVETLDNNCQFTLPDYGALTTASDNCSSTVTTIQNPPAGTLLSGVQTVQITIDFEDDAGNITSCTFNVLTQASGINSGCLEDLFIATLLTPNGDGKNDNWVIREANYIQDCTVQVLNRWGQLVFEQKGYQNDWDGRVNGELLPDGTYYYVVLCNGEINYTGPLTILSAKN